MEKEEIIFMYNFGKIYDRKRCGIGNRISVEEFLYIIIGNEKVVLKSDLYLGMLLIEKKIFLENRDYG